jgi:hypothetical protein
MRANETRGQKTGDETMFTITYASHDNNCSDGQMVRETEEAARRTAELMKACGYQSVTIEAR